MITSRKKKEIKLKEKEDEKRTMYIFSAALCVLPKIYTGRSASAKKITKQKQKQKI